MYKTGINEKKMFVTLHKRMRPVGRSRCRWGDNIATDLNEGGRDGVQYSQ
jgi:hypothetical protein